MASVYKPKDKETGKPKRGAKWRMRFKNENNQWKDLSSGTTCKQSALAEAHRLESEAVKMKSGIVDPKQKSVQLRMKLPLGEQVDAYKLKMNNAGNSSVHVGDQVSILKRFVAHQNVKTASAMSQEQIQKYIATLNDANKSSRTIGKHIAAIRTFCKWMLETDRLAADPTRGIKIPSPSKDRRHRRRMMTREEWSWFASTAKEEKFRWNMSGAVRRLLYWTAIETGYRSGELRELRKSDLSELNGHFFICAEESVTKNGKRAKQYVSVELATELFKHVDKLRPNSLIFNMPSPANVARMLKDDLAAARTAWIDEEGIGQEQSEQRIKSDFLKYENDGGQKLDFHALRHTCGAWLIIAGINVKTVQTVMRHSTPTLTLNTYGHLLDGAEAGAIAALQAAPQQIHSKLDAVQENVPATGCGKPEESAETANEKSPAKKRGSATQCTDIPISAIAPPAGLEPATNGLTVRCSTN